MAAPTSSKPNAAPAPTAAASPSATPSASGELPKQYRPAEHEARIWDRWAAAKAFHADPARVLSGEAKPYCILIPPPNVTARLHLGHALNNTLQDILTRAHRMMGFETLWMPGTDHAGIATQAVVERRVMQEEGKRRTDFERDAFIAKIQAFKDDYEAQIIDQLQKIGSSCDWERVRFTMDEQCARAVREAFFRLFKDGLIYRGKRLVNWDPALQTAVADDECFEQEIDGAFYYLRYPLVRKSAGNAAAPVTWDELARAGYPGADQHTADDPAWVTVATTRPETYLGDVAVAINPHDPRARSLRGLFAELPLVGRIIPIIEDSYVVLPEAYARTDEERADPKAKMATGYLKVTPAHDPNDYEIGRRHAAAIEAAGHPVLVNIFAPDATVSDKHGWSDVGDASLFIGMSREDARKKVVAEFKALGLLEGTKPHKHSVKHSDRSKAVIEPYLSDQWYVRVTDERMAGQANRALVQEQRSSTGGGSQSAPTDNRLQFHPARYAKTYEQWHDGIRDWCISRQLWWGHRIPVWTKTINIDATNRKELMSVGDLEFLDAGRELFGWSVGETSTGEDANRSVGAVVFRHMATGRTFTGDATAGGPPWYGLPDLDGEYEVAVCVNSAPALVQKLERYGFTQDPDVLDTWFSSALWPLSTLGWPESTPLLRAFNPTSTLCTAREIITLWVSRMVMFNRYFLPASFEQTGDAANSSTAAADAGPPPFRDVFVHAVIQDGEGRKMSKSLGNGVDPLDIVESHGADALRYTLCNMTTQTQDVRMPVERDPATGKNTSPKFDMGRNFGNKLWNAARFASAILASAANPGRAVTRDSNLSLADRWMLSRLAGGVQQAEAALREYNFANYAQTLYDLLWRDFCDWYLEAVKPTAREDAAQQAVLAHALETILRLIHPVMPYVTEAIFERIRAIETAPIDGITLAHPTKDGLLTTAGWPKIDAAWHNPEAEAAFDRARALITAIREVRAQHNVPPKRMVTYHPAQSGSGGVTLTDAEAALIRTLANVDTISADAPTGPSVTFTYNTAEHRLSNLADAVDSAAERARLEKLIADRNKQIKTLEGRLANPGYAQKAPPAMVEETRTQLQQAIQERDAASEQLAGLGA